MNKKGIVAVLILISLMLILRLAQLKKEKQIVHTPGPQDTQSEQTGVALPMGAADTMMLVQNAPPPVDMNNFAKPVEEVCPGGSLPAIIANHGQTWGYPRPSASSFTEDQSESMYQYLISYYSCKAVVAGDLSLCDFPAGKYSGRGNKDESPSSICKSRAVTSRMLSVMAGHEKDNTGCNMFMDFYSGKKFPFTAGSLCSASSKGMEQVCRSFSNDLSKTDLSQCLRKFPSRIEDCNSDQNCNEVFQAYKAIKSWQPGACPDNHRGACQAVVSGGDPAVCDRLAIDASALYCGFKSGKSVATGGNNRVIAAMRQYEAEKAYNAKVKRIIQEFNAEGERMAEQAKNRKSGDGSASQE